MLCCVGWCCLALFKSPFLTAEWKRLWVEPRGKEGQRVAGGFFVTWRNQPAMGWPLGFRASLQQTRLNNFWRMALFFSVCLFLHFFGISVSLLLSFSAFLCFFYFIVLCFSASLLLRFSTVLPLCFSAFLLFPAFSCFSSFCFSASSSKMLQIPPKCCKSYSQWEVPTPKCCKDSGNGSFQLQNAANSMENGHNKRTPQKCPKRKTSS